MNIKKGDFIQIAFIGREKENNHIFDLTDEATAKKENAYNPEMKYGPRTICVGEHNIVPGLDDFLVGKETKTYTVELTPEQAFGKKNPKLIKMMPLSVFTKQKIKPFPGLQLNMDGHLVTIKTVSGGRVVVDFNHPVSGRDVVYEITVKKIITDDKEKITHLIESGFGPTAMFTFTDGNLEITLPQELPKEVQDTLSTELTRLVPAIKKVTFKKKEEKKTDKATKA